MAYSFKHRRNIYHTFGLQLSKVYKAVFPSGSKSIPDDEDRIIIEDNSDEIRRWITVGSIANGYGGEEIIDRTVYVETTGNDTTGDGSISNPFATAAKALDDVKFTINGCEIIIQFGIGSFTWDQDEMQPRFAEHSIINGGILRINGTPVLVESGFTLVAQSDPYIYDMSGQTWSANDYQDAFLKVGDDYYGIMSNGTTTLKTFVGLAAGVEIYEMQTVFTTTDATYVIRFSTLTKVGCASSERIELRYVAFDMSTHNLVLHTNGIELRIKDSLFKIDKGSLDGQSERLVFNRVHWVCTNEGLDIYARDVSYMYFGIRKLGSPVSIGLDYKQFSEAILQSVYVENFVTAIGFTFGLWAANQSGHSIILENCTYGIQVRNSTHFTGTLTGFYISSIDYMFSSNETITFGTKVLIQTLNGTPVIGMFHSSVAVQATDVNKDIYWILP